MIVLQANNSNIQGLRLKPLSEGHLQKLLQALKIDCNTRTMFKYFLNKKTSDSLEV